MAGDAATAEQIERIRAGLGLDRPIVVQFGIWLGNVLSGDLGESFYFRIKVATLIGQRLEPTFALATLTILIAVAGLDSARRRSPPGASAAGSTAR